MISDDLGMLPRHGCLPAEGFSLYLKRLERGCCPPYKSRPEDEQMDNNKVLLVIASLLLPPLAVFLKKGAGKDLVINIVLCLCFWVPGILHALWVTLA